MTYFTDSEIIEYYQKMFGWNSKSTKTKNHLKNDARYTMLENLILFMLGHMTVMRISKKKLWSTISILKHDTVERFN